jgi:hypothetical protein
MRNVKPAVAIALAAGLTLSAGSLLTYAASKDVKEAPILKEAIEKEAVPKQAAKGKEAVEPDALKALERMSNYLGTLNSVDIKGETTLDLVTNDGQRIQLGGNTHYRVHRPDGFEIDVNTDFRKRKFFYDGKQFTIFAPDLGYYASAPAPSTIRETLDVIRNKYNISLPLEDLFRWNDPMADRAEKLTSGYLVGPATVDGVATDHYAFRQGDRDWEVWIQKGDQPFPKKLAIVDRSDPAHPAYVARFSWTANPTLAASDFIFKPGQDAKKIHIASLEK